MITEFLRGEVAPESVSRSCSELLYRVTIEVRARAGEAAGDAAMSLEQVRDLMDAIHNIPSLLSAYGRFETEQSTRRQLKAYDDKWSDRDPNHFNLTQILNDAAG